MDLSRFSRRSASTGIASDFTTPHIDRAMAMALRNFGAGADSDGFGIGSDEKGDFLDVAFLKVRGNTLRYNAKVYQNNKLHETDPAVAEQRYFDFDETLTQAYPTCQLRREDSDKTIIVRFRGEDIQNVKNILNAAKSAAPKSWVLG